MDLQYLESLKIDHLVYAVDDLEWGINHIEELTGIKAGIGGRHLGRGTWNALIGMGPDTYFEIIAPDPEQPDVPSPLWLGLNGRNGPKLIRWAAKANDLPEQKALYEGLSIPLGDVQAGSRKTAAGNLLEWELTDPLVDSHSGILPFLIDWKESIHPGGSLSPDFKLIDFWAVAKEPEKIQPILNQLNTPLRVEVGQKFGVCAQLQTPAGVVIIGA